MIDLSSVLPVLVVAIPFLVLMTLLPVFIELKRPRDAGPRLIMEDVFGVSAYVLKVAPIVDIEADWEFGVKPPSKMGSVLGVLPVLEG